MGRRNSGGKLSYLGVGLKRPRVALFDFTGCEGCQLQILNNEGTLLDFLDLVTLVSFREAMTSHSDEYEIAFIEGSITTHEDAERVRGIRARAGVLVALGSCACFGGVNAMRNSLGFDPGYSVYRDPRDAGFGVKGVGEVVTVDMSIYGCPINKVEAERIVLNLVLGKVVEHPRYPVCIECKAGRNVCMYELGEPCLGPVTRAGCGAWCPTARRGCQGCRGPADEPNMSLMLEVMAGAGLDRGRMYEMLHCFGGFEALLSEVSGA